MIKYIKSFFLYGIVLVFLFSWMGCERSGTEIGNVLYKKTENKIYQDMQLDSLANAFRAYLSDNADKFKNPRYLSGFYASRNYEPVLFRKFFADSSFFHFLALLNRIDEHGLSAKPYKTEKLRTTLDRLADKDVIVDVNKAYTGVIEAELLFAEAITQYSFALMYGQINPGKSLPRYFIPVKRPDSLLFEQVLSTNTLRTLLDDLQPKDLFYKQMQAALQKETNSKNKLALVANLERSRWKFEIDSSFLVYVNIPAYELFVLRDKKPIEGMKVVVGKADGHETPMLSSRMHSVQVNPIWNIPASIAKKEILVQAKADKFYLANHGIDVYYKGKKVAGADSIDWNAYDAEHLPYSFKQQPGNTNSLGLIKFLFKNGSSVYLHDTPAKGGFSRKMRAASHGCVRVEKPLELAYALFGEGDKYKLIEAEMQSEDPAAKTISLKPQPQVLLDYKTCAPLHETNEIAFYADVYGLDSVLYRALK